MSFKKVVAAGFLACLATLPATSRAEVVTFDFSTLGTFSGGSSSGSFGNSYSLLGSDGITTVTVTAFGMTQGTSGLFNAGAPYSITTAAVTRNANGLGVCNRAENAISSCGSVVGAGAADNLGFDEFLLFSFSRKVNTTKITLKPTENPPNPLAFADSDAVTYEFNDAISPVGQLFPSLVIGPKTSYPSAPLALPRDLIDSNDTQYSYLIIAADPNDAGAVEDDIFRVGSITGVPLPGTLALLAIAGLAGFGVSRKRAV